MKNVRMKHLIQYFKEKKDFLPYVALFLALGIMPLFTTSGYIFNILAYFGMYLILAMGLNLMIGGVGLLALCTPLFFGVGAYTSALLSTELGVSFLPGLVLAVILGALMAYVVGFFALRVSYHSFAIMTLAFMWVVRLIAYDWVSLTKGPMGIPGIPKPSIPIPGLGTFVFDTPTETYYLIVALVVFSILVFYKIHNSRLGRTFVSIREDESLAEAFGVNAKKYKMIAFIIGGFFGGMAGSYYAHYIQFIAPDIISMHILTTLLIIVIVGGAGYLKGVIIGAALFTIIPEALRIAPEWRDFIYAILLIVVLIVAPEGIYGKYIQKIRRLGLRNGESGGEENETTA